MSNVLLLDNRKEGKAIASLQQHKSQHPVMTACLSRQCHPSQRLIPIFAPQCFAAPHQDAVCLAATATDIMAAVLKSANCPLSLGFNPTVNELGTITVTTTSRCTATLFSPYYEAMTNKLNPASAVGNNHFRTHCAAPGEMNLSKHRML